LPGSGSADKARSGCVTEDAGSNAKAGGGWQSTLTGRQAQPRAAAGSPSNAPALLCVTTRQEHDSRWHRAASTFSRLRGPRASAAHRSAGGPAHLRQAGRLLPLERGASRGCPCRDPWRFVRSVLASPHFVQTAQVTVGVLAAACFTLVPAARIPEGCLAVIFFLIVVRAALPDAWAAARKPWAGPPSPASLRALPLCPVPAQLPASRGRGVERAAPHTHAPPRPALPCLLQRLGGNQNNYLGTTIAMFVHLLVGAVLGLLLGSELRVLVGDAGCGGAWLHSAAGQHGLSPPPHRPLARTPVAAPTGEACRPGQAAAENNAQRGARAKQGPRMTGGAGSRQGRTHPQPRCPGCTQAASARWLRSRLLKPGGQSLRGWWRRPSWPS
jgi:hypothetical protein